MISTLNTIDVGIYCKCSNQDLGLVFRYYHGKKHPSKGVGVFKISSLSRDSASWFDGRVEQTINNE